MTKREEFFLALMEEPSVSKAYKRAGISRSRAYQFLNDETFKEELRRAKQEILSSVTAYLQNNLSECAETLMRIIRSDASPQVKINAAQVIFKTCLSYTEIVDLIPRIEALERISKVDS